MFEELFEKRGFSVGSIEVQRLVLDEVEIVSFDIDVLTESNATEHHTRLQLIQPPKRMIGCSMERFIRSKRPTGVLYMIDGSKLNDSEASLDKRALHVIIY